MNKTKIQWADYTWSPVTGCLNLCSYCYARRIAERFSKKSGIYDPIDSLGVLHAPYPTAAGGTDHFPWGFTPTFHKYRLDEPQKVKKPSKIFVVSMGDLFGDFIPDEWIHKVFDACLDADWHTYLFLTKNPKRYDKAINDYACEERGFAVSEGYWGNCWFGTTITCQDDMHRIPKLLKFDEGHKFLSIEPMLGPVDLEYVSFSKYTTMNVLEGCGVNTRNCCQSIPNAYCNKLDWVIIGQQTGPGAVTPKNEWVQNIIDQCKESGVPVFVKPPLYEKFPIQERPEGLKTQ